MVSVETDIRPTPGSWASFVRPNLPWAEAHFQERISGEPLNPGKEFENWPWFSPSWKAQDNPDAKFSHTYMERFWPKQAGDPILKEAGAAHKGIRFKYGDLEDLVQILARDPGTRQAYLPIWFPEDLAASMEDQRVPCTLGYHFLLRKNRLNCFYPIRSCDSVRYFRDDMYMAGRLVQWLLANLHVVNKSDWEYVEPGKLTMVIPSLHIFEGDLPKIRREHDRIQKMLYA
jgi:thymidylate synthase